ncbi:MAG TPA: hypothetical protein VGQ26_20175 [Streptosporangiaceae bacterium]|nr:hypothetical protein [Streptosporangiaceae bacterium]
MTQVHIASTTGGSAARRHSTDGWSLAGTSPPGMPLSPAGARTGGTNRCDPAMW